VQTNLVLAVTFILASRYLGDFLNAVLNLKKTSESFVMTRLKHVNAYENRDLKM
jgi:hypothetical protein